MANELATVGQARPRAKSIEEPTAKRPRSDSCPDSFPDAQPPPQLPSDSELASLSPVLTRRPLSPVRAKLWSPAPVPLRQQLEQALERVLHDHGVSLQTWTITYAGDDGKVQCCASRTSF